MKRERSISTHYVKLYQVCVIVAASVFLILYGLSFISDRGWIGFVLAVLYLILVGYFWYPSFLRNLSKIKQISYDDEYLYVFERGTYTQIPLERIRDVEIASLDGMYKFNLLDKEAFGPYILCKTSIWYPLNFKKVDKELNHVRSLIGKRKRASSAVNVNQLPSFGSPGE